MTVSRPEREREARMKAVFEVKTEPVIIALIVTSGTIGVSYVAATATENLKVAIAAAATTIGTRAAITALKAKAKKD